MDKKKLLKYLLDNGMIDLQNIDQDIKMKDRNDILARHPYKIWQNSSNQKWYTYLPNETKGRVQKQRSSRGEIEDLIVKFYKDQEDNPTVKEVFYEWMNKRINNEEIEESTYTRYETDFKSYFSEFGQKKIRDVTETDVEDFLKKTVHDHKLTRKAYSNIRTLIYGIFKLAKKKHYIDYRIKDVVSDIEFSKKEFTKITYNDDERVFFELDEKRTVEVLLDKPDIINLGLLLLFKTGLRVGELCTLKPSDISGNVIKIRRTETKYKDRQTGKFCYEVKEHPKTDAGLRDVVMRDDDLWIIKKIRLLNPFGDYLFMRDGKRVREYVFQNRIKTACRYAKTSPKSPHDVRRTYGTKIYDSGEIPASMICKQMGHTYISCLEKYYYYNRKTIAEEVAQINKVVTL